MAWRKKMRIVIATGVVVYLGAVAPDKLFAERSAPPMESSPMRLTSPAFEAHQRIPVQFTCQGEDVSPPLQIENIPGGTKSLALIVDDPDAPMGTWVHWVVFNIEPSSVIAQGAVPGRQGMNDFDKSAYGGPCPPSGTHRYFFKLYALDTVLEAEEGITKADLENLMQGHILASAELVGLYQKQ